MNETTKTNEVTKTYIMAKETRTATAKLWEKHGKRLIYFNDPYGKRLASYDLDKGSWRKQVGRMLLDALEAAFADEFKAWATPEPEPAPKAETETPEHSIIEETKINIEQLADCKIAVDRFLTAFEKSFGHHYERKLEYFILRLQGIAYCSDFPNGTAYGACCAEKLAETRWWA